MDENVHRFFVITGGPGSGKSSLIELLHQHGFAQSIEAGRGVIQDQVAVGGPALPWADRLAFAELMLAWEMRSYHLAKETVGPVFFDRGVPDVLGYLRLLQVPVPDHMRKAAELFRYNPRVFIAPPWREIFRQDRERKQDFEEAVRTYEAMVRIYSESRYELIELPCLPLAGRLQFVLDSIGP